MIANSIAGNITSIIAQIDCEYKRLQKLNATLDRELSEKYHKLEKATISVFDGYQHATSIQETLRKRRVVKGEFARVQSLRHALTFNEEAYLKVCAKDDEIRASLNANYTLEDVL